MRYSNFYRISRTFSLYLYMLFFSLPGIHSQDLLDLLPGRDLQPFIFQIKLVQFIQQIFCPQSGFYDLFTDLLLVKEIFIHILIERDLVAVFVYLPVGAGEHLVLKERMLPLYLPEKFLFQNAAFSSTHAHPPRYILPRSRSYPLPART